MSFLENFNHCCRYIKEMGSLFIGNVTRICSASNELRSSYMDVIDWRFYSVWRDLILQVLGNNWSLLMFVLLCVVYTHTKINYILSQHVVTYITSSSSFSIRFVSLDHILSVNTFKRITQNDSLNIVDSSLFYYRA